MPATKPKPKPPVSSTGRWTNQVFRTADGRLLVRGVDVPAGAEWERVVSGKATGHSIVSHDGFGDRGIHVITDKGKALTIARKAGLVNKKAKVHTR